MTLKEIYNNTEPEGSIAETAFEAGRDYMLERALGVLDAMFMERCSISVDDWFRDSRNLWRGRKEFIKQVKI